VGRCVPPLSGAAKVQGHTRGGECWRWYARGVARHEPATGRSGVERHCRAHAATLRGRRGPIGAAGPGGRVQKATTARPRAGLSGLRTRRTISLGLRVLAISLPEPRTACGSHGFQVPCSGSGETTSVIDAITRRARPEAGLPVLILKIPNNPILQSCVLTRLQLRCNPGARKNVRTRS
jgi:hypothetical protein